MRKRRMHEPFVWHSAAPRRYAPKVLLGFLCMICASAGYLAGRSTVYPDARALSAILLDDAMAGRNTSHSPTTATGATGLQSSASRDIDSGSLPQTAAARSALTGVVLLNPNADSKPKESGRQLVPPAETSDSEHESKAVGRRGKTKRLVRHAPPRTVTRREPSSVAERLSSPSASMSRRDATYRDYRELRESMLR
jgi:hypothetical protein